MRFRWRRFLFLWMCVIHVGFAADLEIVGQAEHVLSTSAGHHRRLSSEAPQHIVLLKIALSPHAQQVIAEHKAQKYMPSSSTSFPGAVQLGMQNVPVLEQGLHGSCVTFAITAIIDAVLNQGDYVSQLCQLQLGQSLELSSYVHSGWSGAWGRTVLHEMDMFGFINKNKQRAHVCGSLSEYPLFSSAPEDHISIESFHAESESLAQYGIEWSTLYDIPQKMRDHYDPVLLLQAIKQALMEGDRLTLGTLIEHPEHGQAGAVGTYHMLYDTWVLSTEDTSHTLDPPTETDGHMLVVTGFDDDAIAYDDANEAHQGLLTLRNSWGSGAGDQGDFYMSYDYFMVYAIEVLRIRAVHHPLDTPQD